jgi:uncharacterized protein (DUF2249 family)
MLVPAHQGPGDHPLIGCAYESETLRGQIESWCPDEYRWLWTAMGPNVWRVDLTRAR